MQPAIARNESHLASVVPPLLSVVPFHAVFMRELGLPVTVRESPAGPTQEQLSEGKSTDDKVVHIARNTYRQGKTYISFLVQSP